MSADTCPIQVDKGRLGKSGRGPIDIATPWRRPCNLYAAGLGASEGPPASCQEATARHRSIPKIPGFGVVFQPDGALAHRARDTVALLEQNVPDFVSLTLWSPNSPDLNPDVHSIWSVGVMQGKVY